MVETIDQEELHQLRNDWLMGEFELENDEDNLTRLEHPVLQRCSACCCVATARFTYAVLGSASTFTKVS